MPHYHYRAIDNKGKLSSGIITAEETTVAKQQLRDQGLTLLQLKVHSSSSGFKRLSVKRRLKPKEVLLFTRQLHSFYEANIAVKQAIEAIISHNKLDSLRSHCQQLIQYLNEGQSLSKALQNCQAGFDELYIAQIQAGEKSGKMAQVLEALARHQEEQITQNHKIRMASLYPSILCFVAFAIVGLLLSTVMPKLIHQLEGKSEIPLLSQIMIKLSEFSQDYGLLVIVALVILIIAKKLFFSHQRWRSKIASQLPIFRELIRRNDASRYLSTIAVLYRAGIPLAEAVSSSASLIKHPAYKQHLLTGQQQLKTGQRLTEFLQDSDLLSPNSLLLISNGEQSGRLGQMLEKAAKEEKQELNNSIDIALAILEPALISLVGIIVFLIVLAILLPLMQMNALVS
ncbi:type II secretion system F family protein [uncultured Pseudoteredinibacter sp.]|uniref:type II secretion system F family protein n=1 Tax=uncultured Pseudoteredinibacter sp. TaxID=1641701 RepID=UPI0026173581|nr:type II secretion system F family protein [uncultured Pseudoteredinibacter sp.]